MPARSSCHGTICFIVARKVSSLVGLRDYSKPLHSSAATAELNQYPIDSAVTFGSLRKSRHTQRPINTSGREVLLLLGAEQTSFVYIKPKGFHFVQNKGFIFLDHPGGSAAKRRNLFIDSGMSSCTYAFKAQRRRR